MREIQQLVRRQVNRAVTSFYGSYNVVVTNEDRLFDQRDVVGCWWCLAVGAVVGVHWLDVGHVVAKDGHVPIHWSPEGWRGRRAVEGLKVAGYLGYSIGQVAVGGENYQDRYQGHDARQKQAQKTAH